MPVKSAAKRLPLLRQLATVRYLDTSCSLKAVSRGRLAMYQGFPWIAPDTMKVALNRRRFRHACVAGPPTSTFS